VFDEFVANWVVSGESKDAGRHVVGAGYGADLWLVDRSSDNLVGAVE